VELSCAWASTSVRGLKRLLVVENPHLVFVLWTRLEVCEIAQVSHYINYANGVFVSYCGEERSRNEGLGILWKGSLHLELTMKSMNHIDVK